MSQIYITKAITASSSLALGSFSSANTTLYTSGASFAVGTSSGSVGTQLDTARRIIVWSSVADASGLTITLTGTSEGGFPITETITGSTNPAAPRATTQDFLSVTAVSFSSQNPLGQIVRFATNTQGGTPWKIFDQNTETFNFTGATTFNSTISTTLANLELTLDDPTQTFKPPVRTLSTSSSVAVPWTPTAFVTTFTGSTALSTANAAQTTPAIGNITTNVAAWRLTLTSSSSTAGGVSFTGLQLGA